MFADSGILLHFDRIPLSSENTNSIVHFFDFKDAPQGLKEILERNKRFAEERRFKATKRSAIQ